MGILSNTVTICHFRVQGELASGQDFFDVAPQALAANAFRPIDDTADELSLGWVHLDDSKEHDFPAAACWRDSYLMFSLRRDQRKIPAALLKEHMEKAQEAFLAENPGFTRVPKQKREEIKEAVRLKLLSKTLPTPAIYDAVWDTQNNLVTFTTISTKTVELFQDHFKKTFEGLRLTPFIPYHRAMMVTPDCNALAAANKASGDSYLELIQGNQWLGFDFMLWLLHQTMNGNAEYRVNQPGPTVLGDQFIGYIDDKVVLCGEGEGGTQMITVNGPQDRFREVKSALQGKKQIVEATIHLEAEDGKWCLTLKGDVFHFAGFSSPAVKIEKDNTVDEQMEREAVFFERMLLLEKGLQLFDSLFATFLVERLGGDWGFISTDINEWINEG